jgi:iron-sulfur cluster assembly accessory protein
MALALLRHRIPRQELVSRTTSTTSLNSADQVTNSLLVPTHSKYKLQGQSTHTSLSPQRKLVLRPTKAAISLVCFSKCCSVWRFLTRRQTPAAINRLRVLSDGPSPHLIRIGVRNKGCAGMSYHLEYVDCPAKFDEVVEQDGVRVLIDSKALFSIIGSEMDWTEDRIRSV